MSNHMNCHANDIQPNTYPPPKPTARDHGPSSEYEKKKLIHRFKALSMDVIGGAPYEENDEYPVYYNRPAPTAFVEQNSFNTLLDPALCLTPDKPSPKRMSRNYSEKPKAATKVHFDDIVEVKTKSPIEDISADIFTSDEDTIEESPDQVKKCCKKASLNSRKNIIKEQFSDLRPWQTFPGGSALPSHIPETPYSKDTYQDDNKETYSSESEDGNVTEDNIETVAALDVSMLSDRSTASSSSPRKETTRKIKSMDKIGSARLVYMENKFIQQKEECSDVSDFGDYTHDLARPEFNTTLRVTKEIRQLKSSEIDVDAAIHQKLQSSYTLRNKVAEKICSVLNAEEDPQFRNLVSVHVEKKDLLQNGTARAKPVTKSKTQSQKGAVGQTPDIMEFFRPGLQRESASYAVNGTQRSREGLKMVDHSKAFDVYRHSRAWEGWQ